MSHLEEHNVGYFPHMWRALKFGVKCYMWTGEVFIHAFFPDMCTDTSDKMKAKIKRLEESSQMDVKPCVYCNDPKYDPPFRDFVEGHERGTWHHNLPDYDDEAVDCEYSEALERDFNFMNGEDGGTGPTTWL